MPWDFFFFYKGHLHSDPPRCADTAAAIHPWTSSSQMLPHAKQVVESFRSGGVIYLCKTLESFEFLLIYIKLNMLMLLFTVQTFTVLSQGKAVFYPKYFNPKQNTFWGGRRGCFLVLFLNWGRHFIWTGVLSIVYCVTFEPKWQLLRGWEKGRKVVG